MTYKVIKWVTLLLAYVPLLLVLSCDNGTVKNDAASDNTSKSVTAKDTAMPREPASAMVSQTDSITPKARNADKDSIGTKISVHKGNVKVVDTAKNDK